MRVIDANAFSAFIKDAVIRQKYDRLNIDNTLTVADVLQSVCAELDGTGLEGFKNAPTVDAVPVVRCKNCIHWGKFPVSTVFPQYHKCGMATYKSTKGDDFCSDGKDGDEVDNDMGLHV